MHEDDLLYGLDLDNKPLVNQKIGAIANLKCQSL
jgi:hypothetical protein